MTQFFWRKTVLFSRYLRFYVFGEHTNFKICDGIKTTRIRSIIFASFFRIPGNIYRKLDQMSLQVKPNISVSLLHYFKDWKLGPDINVILKKNMRFLIFIVLVCTF